MRITYAISENIKPEHNIFSGIICQQSTIKQLQTLLRVKYKAIVNLLM